VTKAIDGARYVLAMARSSIDVCGAPSVEEYLEVRCRNAMAQASLPFKRTIEGISKMIDVRPYLLRAEVGGKEAADALARAGLVGDLVSIDVDVAILGSGAVKSSEIASVVLGDGSSTLPHRAVRLELFGRGEAAMRRSPLDPAPIRKAKERSPGTEPRAMVSAGDAE
jgi:hypothetical protein